MKPEYYCKISNVLNMTKLELWFDDLLYSLGFRKHYKCQYRHYALQADGTYKAGKWHKL